MKKCLHKNLRVALIIVMLILVTAFSFVLYRTVKNPDFEERKVSIYKYTNSSSVGYRAFLKPNILYSGQSLEEGNTYISEFVDHIKAVFSYQFQGETKAEITGTYEVLAVMEGFLNIDEKQYKPIWKKQFNLFPKASFKTIDKKFTLSREVLLNLNQYDSFARQVIKDSQVNSQVKISVFMKVNLKANTDKGIIEEKISPSIVFPLNQKFFEVTKSQTGKKTGAIEKTEKVQMPVNKKLACVYGTVLSILIIGFLYLSFFTYGTSEKSLHKIKLNKIFKQHGNRLVALNDEPSTALEQFRVNSIDDLVRISDELTKPIMYRYCLDFNEINKFFVLDDKYMYTFHLQDTQEAVNISLVNQNEKNTIIRA